TGLGVGGRSSSLSLTHSAVIALDFRRPSPALFDDFERYRDAFSPQDEDMWSGLSAAGRSDVPAYLDWIERSAKNRNLPAGIVPMDTFWVFTHGEMAGELTIRHYIRGSLLTYGGHVGYSVQPKFRGQGVATAMLHFALDRLRTLGEVEALITCGETNAASARVIEKCGGVRIVDGRNTGRVSRRYLIPLSE
ncbi:MAG: GNAT family N-acetyltransferase, partial [Candidatus Eremiobacteraeota bacterium]|nr:GNAT family N-acetyltransferase [Candidatus Eremiobacteraeota bacterium]